VMLAGDLAERLRGRFPDAVEARGEVSIVVGPDGLLDALVWLRDEADLGFGFLSDLTAVDWPDLDPRFWLAYELLSMDNVHRLRLKVGLARGAEPPHAPTVTTLFPTAEWLEREVFDFFGVVFDGHPDLRRIEMPEEWVGHPLRKTEPMGGVNTRYKGAFIPPPDQRGA
jgi:NADH-quinone oxidoreductase subunit C